MQLNIQVAGSSNNTICGDVNGQEVVYSPADFATPPQLSLSGTYNPNAYYSLILANPDTIIPVKPIIHQFVGNIRGYELGKGNLTAATTVFPYFAPNPPIGMIDFHYVYMVYEQMNGPISDWSSVQALSTEKFPIEALAD
jgi:hypothetical protein